MNRILKIGIDVHSTSYTLCAMEPVLDGKDRIFANIQLTPDFKNMIQFIDKLKEKFGSSDTYSIECGYEAGCLGYSLYHQLTKAGVKCTILAPTTMLTLQGKRVKTDKRDALMIAQCLSYAAFLGLAPGESSSGEKISRTGITKAGNSHLRMLLIEAARGMCRGRIGYKSKVIRSRKAGNPAEVIAYADRGNTRMRSKYYRMIRHGKKNNVAVAAVARELACFIWGLMTNNIAPKDKVTWETIQNPYIPDGMIRQQQEQAASRQACNEILLNMQHMIPQNNKVDENNEH